MQSARHHQTHSLHEKRASARTSAGEYRLARGPGSMRRIIATFSAGVTHLGKQFSWVFCLAKIALHSIRARSRGQPLCDDGNDDGDDDFDANGDCNGGGDGLFFSFFRLRGVCMQCRAPDAIQGELMPCHAKRSCEHADTPATRCADSMCAYSTHTHTHRVITGCPPDRILRHAFWRPQGATAGGYEADTQERRGVRPLVCERCV